MRTYDEVLAQLETLRKVARNTSDVDDTLRTLYWVLGEDVRSPSEYWEDYLR